MKASLNKEKAKSAKTDRRPSTPLRAAPMRAAICETKKRHAITILMNFHREGYVASTTLHSALAAKRRFESCRSESIEVVAVIDNADSITRSVIERNRNIFDVVEFVQYRDLASSRNHGVRVSSGEYIAFLDGDDLWGENWLLKAYEKAIQNIDVRCVYHTEYFISFGRENFARIQWDSADILFDPLTLMQNWHFCNNSFAKRDLLLSSPFVSYNHDTGFGSEDWHWSCETIAQGIRHAPVEETAYFYRMRNDEMAIGGDGHLGLGAKANLLVKPSELFNPANHFFQRKAILLSDFIKIEGGQLPQRLRTPPEKLPTEIMIQWQKAGEIDPDCFPTKRRVETISIFYPDIHYTLASVYRDVSRQLVGISKLIFVEFRAHRETLLAINRLIAQESIKAEKVGIVLMSDVNLQEDFEHDQCVVIPLWKRCISSGIGGNEISTLITRLILQLQPKSISNLWSSFFSDAIHRLYSRAFDTLGIVTRNFVYSEKDSDFYDDRFRSEWAQSFIALSENSRCVVMEKSARAYLARRLALLSQSVETLNADGTINGSEAKPILVNDACSANRSVRTPLISCVLNLHKERGLLNSTLSSITEMLHFTVEENITAELVIVLDTADDVTRAYARDFAKQNSHLEISIAEVKNSDLGKSRNDGIKEARGKFVALLDGDDLYSRNWLVKACREISESRKDEHRVVHPQYNIYFGKEKRIYEHKSLSPDDSQIYGLAFTNYWTSLLFAPRDLLLQLPFDSIEFQSGFAFEDWSWNQKSLRHGVSHCVAKDTAHFIRLKNHGSLNKLSVDAGAVYRPAGLFSMEAN